MRHSWAVVSDYHFGQSTPPQCPSCPRLPLAHSLPVPPPRLTLRSSLYQVHCSALMCLQQAIYIGIGPPSCLPRRCHL
eukprot:4255424-Alexandrium_andersonii.AAC.1